MLVSSGGVISSVTTSAVYEPGKLVTFIVCNIVLEIKLGWICVLIETRFIICLIWSKTTNQDYYKIKVLKYVFLKDNIIINVIYPDHSYNPTEIPLYAYKHRFSFINWTRYLDLWIQPFNMLHPIKSSICILIIIKWPSVQQ